jgi:hypothetical protein
MNMLDRDLIIISNISGFFFLLRFNLFSYPTCDIVQTCKLEFTNFFLIKNNKSTC